MLLPLQKTSKLLGGQINYIFLTLGYLMPRYLPGQLGIFMLWKLWANKGVTTPYFIILHHVISLTMKRENLIESRVLDQTLRNTGLSYSTWIRNLASRAVTKMLGIQNERVEDGQKENLIAQICIPWFNLLLVEPVISKHGKAEPVNIKDWL